MATWLRPLLTIVAALPVLLRGAPMATTLSLLLRLVISSAPVVLVVAFFAGAMLTVQAAASLRMLGGASLAGIVVGFGGMREMFPLLAASSVAAKTGAEFAAELATLKSTQQIDALTVMGLSPKRLLVAPRLWAGVLGTPLCVLLSCGAGMWGSLVIGHYQLGIDRGAMWQSLWSAVSSGDVVVGLIKGAVLGFVLAAVSIDCGMTSEGGALGVGRSTNRAVVTAMVSVTLVSLLLTAIIYGGVTR